MILVDKNMQLIIRNLNVWICKSRRLSTWWQTILLQAEVEWPPSESEKGYHCSLYSAYDIDYHHYPHCRCSILEASCCDNFSILIPCSWLEFCSKCKDSHNQKEKFAIRWCKLRCGCYYNQEQIKDSYKMAKSNRRF